MADINIYTTRDGDTTDLIAFRVFGRHGMEMAILEANPFLAALELAAGSIPVGTHIQLPMPAVQDRRSDVQNIWGSGE